MNFILSALLPANSCFLWYAKQVFYAVNEKYWILHQKMLISCTKNIHGYKGSTKTINYASPSKDSRSKLLPVQNVSFDKEHGFFNKDGLSINEIDPKNVIPWISISGVDKYLYKSRLPDLVTL